jgi:hypothetical protein
MEQGEQPFLGIRLDIDEQIAATDQFQVGERGIADQILRGENDLLAQALLDLIAVTLPGEEPLQSVGLDVG